MRLRLVFVTLILGVSGCGDGSSQTCGSGTTLVGGMCVGSGGPTCGLGTTLVDGMCVSSTTCGSGATLVNGMCVGDASCGPGTVLQNGTCVVDGSSPGPVTGLAATASGSSVGLSWTAGTGSTGTLVVRLVAGAYDTPAALTMYTAGQHLPGGATVLADGPATSITDTAATPGRYSYLVWSRNASGKLGFARAVSTVVTVPAQTGSVVVDITAGTATVASQPANVALEAANVVYDSVASTVTFDLSATQNTAGQLYNLKSVFGTLSVGDILNPTATTPTGDPFVTLGLGAILPGIKLTKTVTIQNITATDIVTLPITLNESGLAIAGANAFDVDGGTAFTMQLPALRGTRNTDSVFTTSHPDPSGRYFFGLSRWTPAIFRLDTATGDVSAVVPTGAVSGSGACLLQGPDGFDYAVLGLGTHRHRQQSGLLIARIDPVSLTTVATLSIAPPSTGQVLGCALHGTTLAVGYDTGVYFADIGTMAFIDANAGTANVIDPVAVSSSAVLRLVFSSDGSTLYASEQRTSSIYSIDPVGFTSTTYHTATGNVLGLTIDAADTLWWGQTGGMFSFDGTTETPVPNFTGEVDAIGPRTGNTFAVAARSGNSAFYLDVTDGTVTRTSSINSSRLGHSYAVFTTP